MKTSKTQSHIIEQIMQEHDALRDKVHRIHTVLAEPEPSNEDIEALLREFLYALTMHFSMEEDENGFFDEVTAHAPRLTSQAGKLRIEHKQMLGELRELCRFAAAGSPSMPWWRELRSRCHEFSARLMRHEHLENSLLLQAHQDDLGSGAD
jgi:iron-sulfur cluster repair protein YtfE (RIC family)